METKNKTQLEQNEGKKLRKCGQCGKFYNPDNHTWSAGYGCDYYCSKNCCEVHPDGINYQCPCY